MGKKGSPMDKMSVGAMSSKSPLPMKCGGKAYKKGGSIDGVAKKGKTKGKMVKMAGGGMYRKGGMCK